MISLGHCRSSNLRGVTWEPQSPNLVFLTRHWVFVGLSVETLTFLQIYVRLGRYGSHNYALGHGWVFMALIIMH